MLRSEASSRHSTFSLHSAEPNSGNWAALSQLCTFTKARAQALAQLPRASLLCPRSGAAPSSGLGFRLGLDGQRPQTTRAMHTRCLSKRQLFSLPTSARRKADNWPLTSHNWERVHENTNFWAPQPESQSSRPGVGLGNLPFKEHPGDTLKSHLSLTLWRNALWSSYVYTCAIWPMNLSFDSHILLQNQHECLPRARCELSVLSKK